MNIKRMIYVLVPLILSGCGKEPAQNNPAGEVRLSLIPEVGIEASAQPTRAVVDNTDFFPLLSYGIWIEANDAQGQLNPASTQWYHGLGYDNIMAHRTSFSGSGSAWNFTLNGGVSSLSGFGLFPGKGKKVNIYAIYPYRAGFEPANAEALPFTVGTTDETNYDYMYTGPVDVTIPALNSDTTTVISATLPFEHLMTLLEFRISTTLVGSLRINKITLEAVDAGDNPVNIFCMNGTYSAVDGAIAPNEFTSALGITYDKKVAYSNMPSTNQQKNQQWTSFGFIFPAVDAALTQGTRLKVRFEFDYKNLDEQDDGILNNGGEIELNLGNISTGGTAQGLMKNYRYIYTVSIDNFIKYHGYPEVQPWFFEKDAEGTEDRIYDIIL